MSSKQSGISLSLGKQKPIQSKEVRNVFGEDDSDDEAKPQTSTFQSKYGNLKAKTDRAVQKVIEENPDIYDYDGAYESMQRKKAKIEEEAEAKKRVDKKPKYIKSFMDAKKKRDLESLLRDERKQEKERMTEGDEFKDKDVFVTGAYRKQLEETVQFRKELEEKDRIDELTAVSGQKMWRENFGKKLLEDRMRGRLGHLADEEEKPIKEEPETAHEQEDIKPDISSLKMSETRRRRHDSCSEDEEVEKRRHKHSRRRHDSRSEDEYDERRRRRHDSRDRDRHSKRSYRDYDRPSSKRHHHGDKKPEKRTKMTYREAEIEEQKRRMNAVRKILRKRNGKRQIEEARKRYFERRDAGLIIPPF